VRESNLVHKKISFIVEHGKQAKQKMAILGKKDVKEKLAKGLS